TRLSKAPTTTHRIRPLWRYWRLLRAESGRFCGYNSALEFFETRKASKMNQGANGIVTFQGDIATKTLKRNAGSERLHRFAREVEALRRAREAGVPNVVELFEASR